MHRWIIICLLAAGVSATGCQRTVEASKAKPAPDSGFLADPDKMEARTNRFPFERFWCDFEALSNFTQIKIAPVDTEHVVEMDWWKSMGKLGRVRGDDFEEDRQSLAQYMQEAFAKAIKEDPKQWLELVDTVGSNTQVLELALVEVVPTKAFLNAASKAGGFFVPGGGSAAMFGKGSVAMEGRVRDASTDEIVCMFADREKDKSSPASVADITWYRHARHIIDEWARQYAEITSARDPLAVTDSLPFTLKPW
jgi:hypothetical protein